MNLLVLGGTRFVGRAIVEAALARDHDVTVFNRGTNPDIFPEIARITGDRDVLGDVAQLADRYWDAVVDVNAYRPDSVRSVLHPLHDRVEHYLFISTISVYSDPMEIGADEHAPVWQVDDTISSRDPRAYGGLKVLCEQMLQDRVRGRLTVLRPTILVGEHDYTDRFPWWVRNVARGGTMRVPPRLEQPIQLIDAADLANFVVLILERHIVGTFNAVGPREPMTLGTMIDMLSTALHSRVEPVPAGARDDGTAFPLALPAAGGTDDGRFTISGASAFQHGLRLRTLMESAAALGIARP